MSTDREILYLSGLNRAQAFCHLNGIPMPTMKRLGTADRLYHLATCAFYRPTTITIMVEKCAHRGHGGRAWSWPAYVVDRTPFGVIQHELGHHVDELRSVKPLKEKSDLFSYRIHQASMEPPLTGYLGTDSESQTYFKEWFAEIFRLYVTNPDLCWKLRPRFCRALVSMKLESLPIGDWATVLGRDHSAPRRILDQAQKKIAACIATPDSASDQLVLEGEGSR